jgi:hypothetical protein
VYNDAAAMLQRTASALNDATKDVLADAKKNVDKAGVNLNEAGSHALGAVTNAVLAGAYAVDGTVAVADAGLHAGAGVMTGAVGTAGWVAEEGVAGARIGFLNLSKFFSAVANWLGNHLGMSERVSLETEILGDPTAKRFSERMFDTANNQFKLSGEALDFAWNSYAESIGHAAGTVTNAAFAAMHVGATAANLGAAALQAGAAGPIKMAELAVRAARVGVIYAEKGVEGARDAAIFAAELSAGAANGLARADQDKFAITIKDLEAFEAKVVQLEQKAAA